MVLQRRTSQSNALCSLSTSTERLRNPVALKEEPKFGRWYTTRRLTIIDIVINVAMYMASSWVLLIDQEGIKILKANFIAFMNLHCLYVVIVMMHWYEMWRQICRSNVIKCFKFKGHWHFKCKCLQKACSSEGCGLEITILLCHVDPWTGQLSPPSEVTMNDKSNNANAVHYHQQYTYSCQPFVNKSAQSWWNLSGLSDNLPETLNSAIRKSSSWKTSHHHHHHHHHHHQGSHHHHFG